MAYNVPLSSINASDGNVTYAQGSVLRVGAGGNVNAVGSVVVNANGNVGINDPSPAVKLSVTSSGVVQIQASDGSVSQRVGYCGFGAAFSGTSSNHPYVFLVNDSERVRIATNGRVGIGTTSPQASLHVEGGIRARGGAPGAFGSNDNGFTFYSNSGDTDGGMFSSADGQIEFYTNASEKMRIEADGDVGIGTTVMVGKLTVNGTVVANSTVSDSKGDVRTLVVNSQGTGYTLQASDHGKLIDITTGGVTVPSGVFSVGQNITIYNDSAASQTIIQGASVTLRLAGTATTGTRTLAQRGIATVVCVASNEFVVSGAGLS